MSKANQFDDYMSGLTNSEILEVINRKNDYQVEAVFSAENELKRRNLSENEIEEAFKELDQKKKKDPNIIGSIAAEKISKEVLNGIDLLRRNTVRKRIVVLCIFLIILFLYNLSVNYQLFRDMFFYGFEIKMLEPLITLISLPISGLLIWNRKKLGWIILTSLVTFYLVIYLFLLVGSFIGILIGEIDHSISFNDFKSIINILPLIMVWILINRIEIRKYLNINNSTRWVTIILSILIIPIIAMMIFK